MAGQATAPIQTVATEHHIPANHLSYVGRYTTQISCEDKFVMCERGTVDYILTLLPEGTAHRILSMRDKSVTTMKKIPQRLMAL